MLKKWLAIFALSSGLALAGCNTVHGATEDVESVGDCVDGVDNNC